MNEVSREQVLGAIEQLRFAAQALHSQDPYECDSHNMGDAYLESADLLNELIHEPCTKGSAWRRD